MKPLRGIRLPRYRDALLKHLRLGSDGDISAAIGLGSGVSALKLVQAHEQVLAAALATMETEEAKCEAKRQASLFIVAAMLKKQRRTAADVPGLVEELVKHDPLSSQLTATVAALRGEGSDRRSAELALDSCKERYRKLQEQSERQHKAQREVYRRILLTQEDERKELSRELHDVIAQSLTNINVRLAGLKSQAEHSAKSLDRNISKTQKLVAESVEFVQRFARDLRPAMLDDLGLIPAL